MAALTSYLQPVALYLHSQAWRRRAALQPYMPKADLPARCVAHHQLPDPFHVSQDVVETYLLREIAARSDNFFEAAGVVQDLRGAVGRAYEDVKALRRTV